MKYLAIGFAVLFCSLLLGCDKRGPDNIDDEDAGPDTDTKTSSDADADTDTDSGCGGCLIDSVCHPPDETNPDNVCQVCTPALADSAWTDNDGVPCEDDGDFCTGAETCQGGVCQSEGDPCGAKEMCFEDEDRCCSLEAYTVCESNGNPYFYDSCDHKGELAEECLASNGFCEDGACACPDGLTGPDCDKCVIYVDGQYGDDGNDGTTWDNAKKTVQAGIDLADDIGGEDDCEVWVTQGTYEPTESNDRIATFQLKEGVDVLGGFVGSERARKLRDWTNNKTVLSGDIGIESDSSDNSYHVVTGADDAIIDGFVITGGNGDEGFGGGMYNRSSSPTVVGCTFQGNSAGSGGGIYNSNTSTTVTNCLFQGNSASSSGGGMYNNDSVVVATNCVFTGNSAEYGGGMYNSGLHSTATNCTFQGNSAVDRGGGMRISFSATVLNNCIFWGNAAGMEGSQISEYESAAAAISFSAIEGGCASTGIMCGDGNIDSNPLFVDDDSSDGTLDLSLGPGSPCIDSGSVYGYLAQDFSDLDDDRDIGEHMPVDMSGNTRVLGDAIDIGAYEADAVSLSGFSCPVHVKQTGDDTASSESWDAAVATIERGIYLAIMALFADDNPDACEVWVGAGVYVPTDIDDRFATYHLHPDVHLYGGFKGTEKSLAERVLDDDNEAILSGDVNGDDIDGDLESNRDDNIRRVVIGANNALLDGFTIKGGDSGDVYDYEGRDSAGMYNFNSSPTVTNCRFLDNSANAGGGMLNWFNSSPMVTNCTFLNNSAVFGGGMYNGFYASPAVTNCTFQGNSAVFSDRGGEGGGMYNALDSSATVTNCTFFDNSAIGDGPHSGGNGGGMFNGESGPYEDSYYFPTVTNCIFWNNTASNHGPEIHNVYSFFIPKITYSNVQGGCDADDGYVPCTTDAIGNVDADPLFVDADSSDGTVDLRLTCVDIETDCSPCIDTGLDSAVPAGVTTDSDGNQRRVDISDVGNDGINIVDMGAYEFHLQ